MIGPALLALPLLKWQLLKPHCVPFSFFIIQPLLLGNHLLFEISIL